MGVPFGDALPGLLRVGSGLWLELIGNPFEPELITRL